MLAFAVAAEDPSPTPGGPGATAPAGPAAATAPAASSVTGTASAPSPVAGATVPTASDVAPPSIPPAVTTNSGPDSTAVIATLIGVGVGMAVIALGGWGLIRLIANAGR